MSADLTNWLIVLAVGGFIWAVIAIAHARDVLNRAPLEDDPWELEACIKRHPSGKGRQG